jgi:hypothetical protein
MLTINVQFERGCPLLGANCVASNGRIVLSYKFFKKPSQSRYLLGASDKNLGEEILFEHKLADNTQGALQHCGIRAGAENVWGRTLTHR